MANTQYLNPARAGQLLGQLIDYMKQEKRHADADKLERVIQVMDSAELKLDQVYAALYPNDENPGRKLTQLQSRIRDYAEAAKIPLDFVNDEKTRSAAENRVCGFVEKGFGKDKQVKDFAEKSIEDGKEYKPQSAKLSSGKPLIRYFISSARDDHGNNGYAKQFIENWQKFIERHGKYRFKCWHDGMLLVDDHWDEKIKQALDECDLGILLLSSSFFSSEYIKRVELPKFIFDEASGKTPEKKAVPVGLVNNFPLDGDLLGLQNRQIFLFNRNRFYNQCTGPRKNDFLKQLADQVTHVLERDFSVSIAGRVDPKNTQSKKKEGTFDQYWARNVSHVDLGDQDFYYEPNKASKSEMHKALSEHGEVVDAIDDLLEWCRTPDSEPYCALLGELGMGKTTNCHELTRRLLHSQQESDATDKQKTEPQPLPIYLDLRYLNIELAKTGTLSKLLDDLIERNFHTGSTHQSFDHQDVINLVQNHAGLVIFDGLDEVLVHLDEQQGKRLIRELWRTRPLRNKDMQNPGKVLLSCRSHYFRTLRDEVSFLSGESRESMESKDYRVLNLMPFNEEQINAYIEANLPARKPKAVWEIIRSVHNLSELVPRPYLLKLITGQIEQLEQSRLRGETVMGVTLYRNMTLEWLDRDDGKHQFNKEHKQLLMQQVAYQLWAKGERTWTVAEMEQWLLEFIDERQDLRLRYVDKARDLLLEDLRTATFLVRPDAESFRFAHTSLLEYFLASNLQQMLIDGNLDAMAVANPSPETLDFLGQLLVERPDDKATQSLKQLTRQYRKHTSEWLLSYCWLAVKQGYPSPSLVNADFQSAQLRARVFDAEGLSSEQTNRLSLQGADFSKADLRQTLWRGLKLNKAVFSHAHLRRSFWHSVELNQTVFNQAELTAAIFRQCQFSQADMYTAQTYRTQWLGSPVLPTQSPENSHASRPLDQYQQAILSGLPVPTKTSKQPILHLFQSGHKDWVNSCAFSPDGLRVLSGSRDGSLKLWDISSGECEQTLRGHKGWVISCAFSPDGSRVLSGGGDGKLKLWDVSSGDCELTLKGHKDWVRSCTFSPEGSRVLSGSNDGSLKLWDIFSGDCEQTLRGHKGWVSSCAFSPDGLRVLSGSRDGSLKLWDISSGECEQTLRNHKSWVRSCTFSPDGTSVLSGNDDGSLKLWDVFSGDCEQTLRGHNGCVRSCTFSPDGLRVLSGGDDGSLKLWDVSSSDCEQTLRGHKGWVSSCAFSPDGLRVLSGSRDGNLKLWDIFSGDCEQTLRGHKDWVSSCAFSPDGSRVLSGSNDGNLKLWDIFSGDCEQTLRGHKGWVRSCTFSPDGSWVLSGSDDGSLKLWDISSGECEQTFRGHKSWVRSCSFSPDGTQVLSGSRDGSLKLWDILSGDCEQTLRGHKGWVSSCVFSPDGFRVLSGSRDGNLKLWDVSSGDCEQTMRGEHKDWVRSCAFSPDGLLVLSGGNDGSLKLWDISSGECEQTLRGHKGWVSSCTFSPDGLRVLSGSRDGSLKLWDVSSGDCEQTMRGQHKGWVRSCAFSPDGSRVLSGGGDGSLKLWDVSSGECELTFYPLTADGRLWTQWFCQNAYVTIDERQQRVLSGSEHSWPWLGYQVSGADGGVTRYPAETFGSMRELLASKPRIVVD